MPTIQGRIYKNYEKTGLQRKDGKNNGKNWERVLVGVDFI